MKVLTLTSTDSYSTGKVVVLTGTCGTVATTVAIAPTTYRDSAGSLVSFSSVSRIAFGASANATATTPSEIVRAAGDRVSVTDCTGFTSGSVSIAAASGTATYKLVLYGA
jgi:hypothetical protein